MNINFKEVTTGEDWEFFARDFLSEVGFVIETPPGRGADAGKDLLVSEQLRGLVANTKFSWLVSCKNNAASNNSVGLDDEVNIIERLKQHGAKGFVGFYSTVASSALINRLHELVKSGNIEKFEIFDAKKIEARFAVSGFSKLLLRYFPQSYASFKPIQDLFSEYEPLICEICNKDVLKESVGSKYRANIVHALARDSAGHYTKVPSVHIACKGDCDRALQGRLHAAGFSSGWEDVTDLINPLHFLKNVIAYTNILHGGFKKYSPEAHESQKKIYIALAQCTLREASAEDQRRFIELVPLEGL